jgi:hypothetical protein
MYRIFHKQCGFETNAYVGTEFGSKSEINAKAGSGSDKNLISVLQQWFRERPDLSQRLLRYCQ